MARNVWESLAVFYLARTSHLGPQRWMFWSSVPDPQGRGGNPSSHPSLTGLNVVVSWSTPTPTLT